MSDSNIQIEVWLPKTTWNGRFLGTGGGGFQGTITYSELAAGIQQALARGETNYPPSSGILALREAVQRFYARELPSAGDLPPLVL